MGLDEAPEIPAPALDIGVGRFQSSRERLRARRRDIQKVTTIDLVIPSYGDEFAVRYEAIEDEDFARLVRKIQAGGNTQSNLGAAMDLLSKCCQTVLVREGEEFEPLVDDADDPIQFDDRLAEFFDFEGGSAREVITGVFSPEDEDGKPTQPLAAGVHALALIEFMQGNMAKIDAALLGE